VAALSIQALTVRLGGRTVLESLDLEVADGEFLVLLGPSGCGKSTLLHAIAGLQDVHAGRLLIDGEDHTTSDPAARNVGLVFQSYALYPNMTVEGNLGFGLRARGLPRAEVAARVQRAAAMLQLEPLLARRPAQLSGGQRQRVAIGRALVRDARLFLLDEPLSNLDAGLRATLRRTDHADKQQSRVHQYVPAGLHVHAEARGDGTIDEDRHDQADPGTPSRRTHPVALERDPLVAPERGQPEQRDHRQPDGEAHQDGTDEPGAGVLDRVLCRHDKADQDPDDEGRPEQAQVREAVTRFHDQRV